MQKFEYLATWSFIFQSGRLEYKLWHKKLRNTSRLMHTGLEIHCSSHKNLACAAAQTKYVKH